MAAARLQRSVGLGARLPWTRRAPLRRKGGLSGGGGGKGDVIDPAATAAGDVAPTQAPTSTRFDAVTLNGYSCRFDAVTFDAMGTLLVPTSSVSDHYLDEARAAGAIDAAADRFEIRKRMEKAMRECPSDVRHFPAQFPPF